MSDRYLDQFSSPVSKLVRFFQRSRDRWKTKQQELKAESKLLSNQTRAVEKSRRQWRERAFAAERRIKELERELKSLKSSRPPR